MTREEKFMMEAIALSKKGSEGGEGGPFGCVIVKDNEVVGRGNNKVLVARDPTAHAEIMAIRDACINLGTHQLDGCEVYTTCEPCPMCLGAIYWARPAKIFYANNKADAAAIGFDDSMIYEECSKPLHDRLIPMENLGREQAIKVFESWQQNGDKNLY